jgi:hypothetical protein
LRKSQQTRAQLVDELGESLGIAAAEGGDQLTLVGVLPRGTWIGLGGQPSCSATETVRPLWPLVNSTTPARVAKMV